MGLWRASPTAGVVARKQLNLYFSLPDVCSVPVKVGLEQAGSSSGFLTPRPPRPQSPTVGASRGDLRSAQRRGQETLAERAQRGASTAAPTTHRGSAKPWAGGKHATRRDGK